MTLGDDLPTLITDCEAFSQVDPKKAARNLSNAEVFLVVDHAQSRVLPIYWLLHVRGAGKSFSDNKRSNQSLKRFRPELTQLGYNEISEGEIGFEEAWKALVAACLKLDTSPSNRTNKPNWTGRSFFVKQNHRVIDDSASPEDISSDPSGTEGAHKQITTNRYERDPNLRKECITHYLGDDLQLRCLACDFSFGETYGEIGNGFIHIHHLNPLGNGQSERLVDPTRDLIPLCPNCHAMAHRGIGKQQNPRTVLELTKILDNNKSSKNPN